MTTNTPILKTVIFDLDGTLADLTHRLHYVSDGRKQWDQFFKACGDDKPIGNVVEIQKQLRNLCPYKILIVSGRSDVVKEETVAWLKKHGIFYDALHMRAAGDNRADDIVKEEILNKLLAEGHQILCVFDDRQRVVNMWRKRGITCFQVSTWEERKPLREKGLLTLMVGPSGAGKSTWLAQQCAASNPNIFPKGLSRSHIVSTDEIRQELTGDFRNQTQNNNVWAAAESLIRCRINHGLPAILDATNIKKQDRLKMVALAQGGKVHYIVINRPMEEKRRDGGWRNGVGFDLLQKHENIFQDNLKDILNGDGLPNVEVMDAR